ncbi:MAG: DUF6569 family protein [Bacteroidota bacterium]
MHKHSIPSFLILFFLSAQASSLHGQLQIGQHTILPAAQHQNLQIFLITGQAELGDEAYLTLSEALDKKKAVVRETGTVSQLAIDNLSDETIFIHSGDIVKGGKQDRTMAYDVIIPPKAKNVALSSFCVERGRWRQRGKEQVGAFSSNTRMLSNRKLKLAAKYEGSQQAVWYNVSEQQKGLNRSLSKKSGKKVDVSNAESASSLQLALENQELEKHRKEMTAHFEHLIQDQPSALGYAYAINGEVMGVDLYNNRRLFSDLWEKLLTSMITEALSEEQPEKLCLAEPAGVFAFMEGLENESVAEKAVNKETALRTYEHQDRRLLFSTEDNANGNWVHKNYMKGEKPNSQIQLQQQNQLNVGEQRLLNSNQNIRRRNRRKQR